MKQCSQCKQIYTDDDLNFCLSDGASLTFVPDSSEETMIRSSLLVHEQLRPSRQGVNPIFAYATIALLALILGGAVVYWVKSDPNSSIGNANSGLNNSRSVTEKVEATPVPPDKSVIENEVKTVLDGWTQTLVKRDFDGHLQYYADRVDVFYKDKNVDFSFIRNHYLKLFKKYDTFGLINSDIKTDVDPTTEQAVTTSNFIFDFRGSNAFHSSVSTTEFRWKKINGAWKITGEKDLKNKIYKK